jgi:hypothetical protein
MRRLTKFRRIAVLLLLVIVVAGGAWLYWNRVTPSDLAAWAPADCLAYVEVNDLSALTEGLQQTTAWKSFAPLLGAPTQLAPSRSLIRMARWTGVGGADAVLFARSQVAVIFSGAEGTQDGSTLIVKPLLTLVIETHTSQRRMRGAIEQHLEQTARDIFGNPTLVRKQVSGIELEEWQSQDGSRKIVFSFVDTAVIVANDEGAVLHAIEAGTGKRPSLRTQSELEQSRRGSNSQTAALFGFVTQPGIKSLLQAYWLKHEEADHVSSDSLTRARLFAGMFGSIVNQLVWTARFTEGAVEDRFLIALAPGVTDRLRTSMAPASGPDLAQLPFVPPDSHSISLYAFHDTGAVWSDLGAVIASHADLLGAVAARPAMQKLLSSYGVVDTETFTRAIGTRMQTVRAEEQGAGVLIAEVFDRPAIDKAIAARFGGSPRKEKFLDADLFIAADNWTAAFLENNFLIGPGEQVRRCLQTRAKGESVSSTQPFREAQRVVDVSQPLTVLTFANDSRAAVSFVDSFSHQSRSAFSTNAGAINQASQSLPLAMSAVVVKEGRLEWTSRSSFGIAGAMATELLPAK